MNDTTSGPSSPDAFPIVGVGASAGGLEALTRLFSQIPADCGMAFLVVQHLAAGHASMLVEILSQKAHIAVVEAVDGQPIEGNIAYVIPPKTSMTLRRGHIHLRERDDSTGQPMPINDLFLSLARETDFPAIAVVLSGSGTDGAEGVWAVKNKGGITMAQDELTAQFKSMPQAAAIQGGIDFVGSPEAIAARLVTLVRHPYLQAAPRDSGPDDAAGDEEGLKRVFHLLNDRCGIDFSHYKRGTVTRRLARKMGLLNLNTLPELCDYLEHHPEELKTLHKDILIPVTCFFRDPEIFEELTSKLFPALVADADQDKPLRIWVAGCSSGEEVYSIAICLFEYLESHERNGSVQIFGTDLNEDALALARSGTYQEGITRQVSPARLSRFFTRTKGGYQIVKQIRDSCIFARHNVCKDAPFSNINLISCRNLLIYLDVALQKQVLHFFHYSLAQGGFLFLGPSETLGQCAGLFNPCFGKQGNFYKRASAHPRPILDLITPSSWRPEARRKNGHAVAADPLAEVERQKTEADYIIQSRYVPAGVICNEKLQILEFRGDTTPYLMQPAGPASTNLQQLARPGLLVEIRSLLERARRSGATERSHVSHAQTSRGIRRVHIEVVPLLPDKHQSNPWFLVFFRDDEPAPRRPLRARLDGLWRGLIRFTPISQEMEQLREELGATREHLRIIACEHEAAVEQLKASQEELLSSNEEFQSTNEELETAKEELQSANEELITTNDELRHRNGELSLLNEKLKFTGDYADAIIDTMKDPLLVLDGDLRIVRANGAFLSFGGLKAETVEHSLLFDLAEGQWGDPALRGMLGKALAQDSPFLNYEIHVSLPHRHGESTVLISGTRLSWMDQSLILLSFEDITQFKTDTLALQESVQRRDEFLAMLAHELRNPLEPVLMALDVWRRDDVARDEEREAQEIMDRQIRKLVRLVDDLLDVGRITRNSIALEKVPVNLGQVCSHAVEGMRYLYEARRHNLEIHLPRQPLTVEGDAVRLEQVVSNLLSNAAKYTEPGGEVSLTLRREGDDAVITVADNGIGLAPEFLPRVFDLFVQAKAGLDRTQGGLGVGLSLVRRLVVEQGGSIRANSEGLHRGSQFTVRFPVLQLLPEPSGRTVEAPAPSDNLERRRILLVEDNVDSLRAMTMLLRLQGHDVQTAPDAQAAIEVARTFHPEVTILDIGLPGMNGYQLAVALRELPGQEDSLILSLSGYGTEADRELSRLAGIHHHLVKPVNLEDLTGLIGRYFMPGEPSREYAESGPKEVE